MGCMSQELVTERTSPRTESLLQVENLNVVFRSHSGLLSNTVSRINAVSNVSLDLNESAILSIVGESGSGKTTIARCIASLNRPTSGSIKYRGTEVTTLSGKALKEYKRDVQIIFQDPYESLNPRFDVYTTVSLPIRHLVREKDERILHNSAKELMREVNLSPELIHRYPHQLSGGERQRVNIARALASSPRILVADEPITMLDAAQRVDILRLLLDLKDRRRLAIILITHDLATAKMMGGKVLVMYRGKLVESGHVESVLRRPHHPYVEVMSEAMPSLTKKLQYTETEEANVMTNVEVGCIFRPRCRYALPVCAHAEPNLEEKSKSHFAACHNPLLGVDSKSR